LSGRVQNDWVFEKEFSKHNILTMRLLLNWEDEV
jgi:hypothetical protein